MGPILTSHIILNLEDNLEIPFDIYAIPSRTNKANAITPFNQQLGYQIDPDDLNIDMRVIKHESLVKKGDHIDFSKAPNYIEFRNLFSNINVPISQTMLNLFKTIRLYAFFPTSKYESKPNERLLKTLSELKGLLFNSFYPVDVVPLPKGNIPPSLILHEGLNLYVPSDPEKLSQIRATFVLAEEQPEKTQA